MKFRKHFDYDVDKASDESAVGDFGPSLTVQSMAEDADINVLMERFGITGRMPDNPRVPMYGDFTDVKDYQSALNAIMFASDAFMALPAKVRARFDNDPQQLLEFCADDRNLEEARSLGLLKEADDHGSRPPGGGSGSPAAAGDPQAGGKAPAAKVGSGGDGGPPGGGKAPA